MVQESHFSKGDSFTFASRYFPLIYQAFSPRKRAGVAILIKRGTPFTCTDSYIDPLGHFIILRGTWHSRDITLCTLYAPNAHQHRFLSRVLTRLAKSPHDLLVVGGDFNLPHSATWDRLVVNPRASQTKALRDSKLFRQLTRKHALFDAWRALHPGDRQFTFYSSPHHTHSRIDYFLVNNTTLRVTDSAQILPISWSDHAPLP